MRELEVRESVALAPMTTFRLGGPARWFVAVRTIDELREAIGWAAERGTELFFLGGGSNLVVADEGFDGLVVKIELAGIHFREEGGVVSVRAAAGEPWDPFVATVVARGLAGVECLSGIPGSVGATPIQNVGAYGQEVAETISAVEVLDRRDLTLRTLSPEECQFGYRSSFFKNVDPARYVVTAVTYDLVPGGAPALRYPELQKHVEERFGDEAGLHEVREAVLSIRRKKGMVVDESDPDTRSAGSFFMNPLLTEEAFERFAERAGGVAVPRFPAADGRVKTSAAWLIEHAGFTRGYGEGRIGISSKHTLALVNRGGGNARELVALVREIQAAVREKFGVELHPEPNFVGFDTAR